MSFVHRYEEDTSAPTVREAASDLARRTLLPALGLWAVVVGIGLLVVGPLQDLPGEDVVNEWFVEQRTPTLDALTSFWSNIGATLFIITTCVVIASLIWWRTRQWWLAVVPAIAMAVQAAVFVTSALVVGRERPDVEKLDVSPPTSSFPSGHVGASTAFYLALALLSQRIRTPLLRWGATALCFLIPLLVAYARLYRGMHHLSDVVVGMLNGIVCALLAWNYLRRDTSGDAAVSDAAVSDAAVSDATLSDAAVAGAGEGVHAVGGEAQPRRREQGGTGRESQQGV